MVDRLVVVPLLVLLRPVPLLLLPLPLLPSVVLPPLLVLRIPRVFRVRWPVVLLPVPSLALKLTLH
jgi:hypothetical protein